MIFLTFISPKQRLIPGQDWIVSSIVVSIWSIETMKFAVVLNMWTSCYFLYQKRRKTCFRGKAIKPSTSSTMSSETIKAGWVLYHIEPQWKISLNIYCFFSNKNQYRHPIIDCSLNLRRHCIFHLLTQII